MNFERSYKSLLQNRLIESRRFIQVVYGPRQVGKTTMVNQILKSISIKSHYALADGISVEQQSWISQQWEIARVLASLAPDKQCILVFDEIQKLGNWSEIIKKEWDTDTIHQTNVKLVLLGSSRILLQQGLTESLAGRYETTYMGHWTLREMNEAFGFTVDEYVWFGGYPGASALIKDEKRWRQYVLDSLVETSISKDILMLTRVDKPALMRKLFDLGCHFSGQILSFNKILGQLLDAGNTTTLANYLSLLDTAGLLSGLEKYSPDLIRQRSSSPKFLVYNTGLMSALSEFNFEEIRVKPDYWGRWVESAVGSHLLNSARSERFDLFYWRDRNDEIDFVLQKGERIVALEVKSGFRTASSGIEAFKRKFSGSKILLIGNGGLPISEFLKMNPADLF